MPKYEDKYLEQIRNLDKEFKFDDDEEIVKNEKYYEFISTLKSQELDKFLIKLNEVNEKILKYEKREDTYGNSESDSDYEENDDKDEDKEDDEDEEDKEEDDDEEYDDEEDPIKIEIRKINEEIKELNINKLKKDNYVDYLRRLNIKNIKGKNTKHCNKQDLCDYLIEKLEN